MDLTHFSNLRIVACDLNGQMRGKRVPISYAGKLAEGAVKMPLSVLNLDMWGADIENSPLVFETGDADGFLVPTDRPAMPMPWLDTPSALVPMTMLTEDRAPFEGDPRQALSRVLDRYGARGWSVVAATEMEFTLIDDAGDAPAPPQSPIHGRALSTNAILSITQLDAFDRFFSDVDDACDAMGIPAETMSSEAGLGQFEITLNHQNALRAADDAWLFKTMLRGMARKHGFAATFMAKPYADDAGNGMHVHFSVLDADGNNIFDNGGPEGTDLLRHAVAGCIDAMPASTLIFAPYENSYARLVAGAHAPVNAAWAYENRTAAIRIPNGPPKARRIEHRVAGGDVNPYLVLAVILGAAFEGIEAAKEPPAPIVGNAYDVPDLPRLKPDWALAVSSFETNATIQSIFHPLLIENLCMTKRQEIARMSEISPENRWLTWLERV